MRLDPDLAAGLAALPDLHIHDLAAARTRMRELAARAVAPEAPGVTIDDIDAPGADGDPPASTRVFRPPGSVTRPVPGLLLLHGGGFVMGDLDGVTAQAVDLCDRLGAVVVAVGYRLAPEHPYPAACGTASPRCAGPSARRRRSAWIRPGSGCTG